MLNGFDVFGMNCLNDDDDLRLRGIYNSDKALDDCCIVFAYLMTNHTGHHCQFAIWWWWCVKWCAVPLVKSIGSMMIVMGQ